MKGAVGLFVLLVAATVGACAESGVAELDENDPPDSPAVDTACPAIGPGVSVGGSDPPGADLNTAPERRLVLMGGGPEVDSASSEFVRGANGGDIVVLRASGSVESYPRYFLQELQVEPSPASALAMLTDPPSAGQDPGLRCRVDRAEAIWLAGGDQWNYLGNWPDELRTTLADAVVRDAAFGGTSAGAVVLGEAAFDARFGTVSSEQALQNPYDVRVSLSYPEFAQRELRGTIVDSHFMNRNREGRLLVFAARFAHERSLESAIGVGLDERAAIVIASDSFRVASRAAASVWVYRVAAPDSLPVGKALNLSHVERTRLRDGDAGPWPPDPEVFSSERLRVVDGTVTSGSL